MCVGRRARGEDYVQVRRLLCDFLIRREFVVVVVVTLLRMCVDY